jgi:hypothetical protein
VVVDPVIDNLVGVETIEEMAGEVLSATAFGATLRGLSLA